jgi:hypothetical protein
MCKLGHPLRLKRLGKVAELNTITHLEFPRMVSSGYSAAYSFQRISIANDIGLHQAVELGITVILTSVNPAKL